MDCRKSLSNKSQPDTQVRNGSLGDATSYVDVCNFLQGSGIGNVQINRNSSGNYAIELGIDHISKKSTCVSSLCGFQRLIAGEDGLASKTHPMNCFQRTKLPFFRLSRGKKNEIIRKPGRIKQTRFVLIFETAKNQCPNN